MKRAFFNDIILSLVSNPFLTPFGMLHVIWMLRGSFLPALYLQAILEAPAPGYFRTYAGVRPYFLRV